jgi:hypothetical protein
VVPAGYEHDEDKQKEEGKNRYQSHSFSPSAAFFPRSCLMCLASSISFSLKARATSCATSFFCWVGIKFLSNQPFQVSGINVRKDTFMKPLLLILIVLLFITPLMANVRAENWAWTKAANNANLNSIDMISSTDGWIVGADGVYRWQEVRGFPADYLVFIIVIIVLVAVSLLVYFKKHKR